MNDHARLYSGRNHAHLIRLQSTTHGEVTRPPLLLIGNRAWIRLKLIVGTATIQIMKIVWVTYLGAFSLLNAILIPRILAHTPVLAQCKVHCPWALFCEGTVHQCSTWPLYYYIIVEVEPWLNDIMVHFFNISSIHSHAQIPACMVPDCVRLVPLALNVWVTMHSRSPGSSDGPVTWNQR